MSASHMTTSGPEVIYLEPACCADPEVGRQWCQSHDGFGHCENGVDPTKYIRADLVPQWHPIETAPKDGTAVDLWVIRPARPGRRYPDCIWDGEDWVLDRDRARIISIGAIDCNDIPLIRATHWMLRLKPPGE